jgi:non-heme chloroperoxidase
MEENEYGTIATNDGVNIRYIEKGAGEVIILLPGFSQSAREFRKQVDGLSDQYRVVALDHRGHGESDKPMYGYRIARLAADLRALILALDIEDVTLLGHSLGCMVIWSYWDLYGGERIKRMIVVDQGPVGVEELAFDEPAEQVGALFSIDQALQIAADLRSDRAMEISHMVVDRLYSAEFSVEEAEWLFHQNLLLPREHAATLQFDYSGNDWRDVLPRITVPTLIIGGELSYVSTKVAKTISERIPESVVRVFSAAEKGSHLMFWENPTLFNAVVSDFMEIGQDE